MYVCMFSESVKTWILDNPDKLSGFTVSQDCIANYNNFIEISLILQIPRNLP